MKNPWERQALGKGFRRQELCGAPEISEHSCLPDLSTVLPSVHPTERLFSRNPDFKTSLGLFLSRSSQIPCFSVASQQMLPRLPLLHPRPVLPFTSPAHGPPGLALSSGPTLPGGAAPLPQLAQSLALSHVSLFADLPLLMGPALVQGPHWSGLDSLLSPTSHFALG